jgi:hypothetical protein
MSPSGGWTVLVTVSSGFQDMFDNWWHYLSLLKLSLPVIVVAEDNATYTRYKNNINFTVVKGLNQSDGEKAFDYSTKQFKALVSNRPTYILAFIKRGLNVIYTDVDTIWLKDPRSFLNGDYDMWASMDGPVHYCTGFMAFKPSLLSVDLLENWKASLVTPDINQIKFNSLVKKSEIKHKPLPRSVFPDGRLYFARGIRRNVVIVHNNYIIGHDNKVQRFKSVGLWWNNEGP